MTTAEILNNHLERYPSRGVAVLRVDAEGLHMRCGRERLLIAHDEQITDAYAKLHEWVAQLTGEADSVVEAAG